MSTFYSDFIGGTTTDTASCERYERLLDILNKSPDREQKRCGWLPRYWKKTCDKEKMCNDLYKELISEYPGAQTRARKEKKKSQREDFESKCKGSIADIERQFGKGLTFLSTDTMTKPPARTTRLGPFMEEGDFSDIKEYYYRKSLR